MDTLGTIVRTSIDFSIDSNIDENVLGTGSMFVFDIQLELVKYSNDSTEIILNSSNIDHKYTKLIKLDCKNCLIDSIINIPETLEELDCSQNHLHNLDWLYDFAPNIKK